jgi:hypothetical protein
MDAAVQRRLLLATRAWKCSHINLIASGLIGGISQPPTVRGESGVALVRLCLQEYLGLTRMDALAIAVY